WSWGTFILPYMEQQNLYNQLNPPVNPLGTVMNSNPSLLQMPIKMFLCPSDLTGVLGPYLNDNRPFFKAGPQNQNPPVTGFCMAKSNYAACGGDTTKGVFDNNTSTRITDITDGSSNTILIGERASKNAGKYNSFAALVYGVYSGDKEGVQAYSVLGWTEYSMQEGSLGQAHNPQFDWPTRSFGSLHTAGANFLFGDGSVHFLSSSIDWAGAGKTPRLTYNILGGMQDGLTPGPW